MMPLSPVVITPSQKMKVWWLSLFQTGAAAAPNATLSFSLFFSLPCRRSINGENQKQTNNRRALSWWAIVSLLVSLLFQSLSMLFFLFFIDGGVRTCTTTLQQSAPKATERLSQSKCCFDNSKIVIQAIAKERFSGGGWWMANPFFLFSY
jgi:hypothetical protein